MKKHVVEETAGGVKVNGEPRYGWWAVPYLFILEVIHFFWPVPITMDGQWITPFRVRGRKSLVSSPTEEEQ